MWRVMGLLKKFPSPGAIIENLIQGNSKNACNPIRNHVKCIRCPAGRADIAQQVEHFLGKEEVTSSNLVISSIERVRDFRIG